MRSLTPALSEMVVRKVLGRWLQQYTCPDCGNIGGSGPGHLPLCHLCHFKVRMLPSHNGKIYEDWKAVFEKNKQEAEQDPDEY